VLRDRIAALDPVAAARLTPLEDSLDSVTAGQDEAADAPADDTPVGGVDFAEEEEEAEEEQDDGIEIDVEIDLDSSDLSDPDATSDGDAPVELEASVDLSADEDGDTELDADDGIEIEVDSDDFDLSDELDVGEGALETGAQEAMELAGESGLSSGPPEVASEETPQDDESAALQQVSDDLEEAEFYFQQDMFDEAEAIYVRVLAKAPKHPGALRRLEELSQARGDQPAKPSARVPAAPELSQEQTLPMESVGDEAADEEEGGFDFAAELREEFDVAATRKESAEAGRGSTAEVAFQSIFNDFKRGVSETLSDGDYETRYDLGIAYREMELYDDAVGEFTQCLASPTRRLDSLCMLALCAIDLDRCADAVSHLEQALATPDLSDECSAGIHFDLGRAQQRLGEVAQARRAFNAVIALDADFPGVAEMLASLEQAPGSEADEATEDPGESFADLLAEVEAEDEAEASQSEPAEALESFDDLVTDDPELEQESAKPTGRKPKRKKKKISFL
jgi:tetratricopeptide (TPR) repeat protein